MTTVKPTKASIEALLNASQHSSSNKAALESYISAQVAGEQPFFARANRILLKLYKSSGFTEGNKANIATVLLLSLLNPTSDSFLALSYLLPDSIRKSEPCDKLFKCQQLWNACNFVDFWTELAALEVDDNCKALVAKSTPQLQTDILGILALSYHTCATPAVLTALGASSSDYIAKLSASCVESVTGEAVTFVATADNTKRSRMYQESISFSTIASMVIKVQAE